MKVLRECEGDKICYEQDQQRSEMCHPDNGFGAEPYPAIVLELLFISCVHNGKPLSFLQTEQLGFFLL